MGKCVEILDRQVVVLICLLFSLTATAQSTYSVNMVGGNKHINGCLHRSGIIYDDGGATANYSGGFDGSVTIVVPIGTTITLTGTYVTEPSYDYIRIYNTSDGQGSYLYSYSGNGNISTITSTTGYLTISFHSDMSVQRSGFALQYTTNCSQSIACNDITDLRVSSIGYSGAYIEWEYEPDEMFGSPQQYIVTVYDNATNTLVFSDTTARRKLWVTGLQPSSSYQVNVISLCAANAYGMAFSENFTTLAVPCVQFQNLSSGAIGTGTSTTNNVPVCYSYGNTLCQSIYTASELRAAGLQAGYINEIRLGFTGNYNPKELNLCLGTTNSTTCTSTPINPIQHTLVYGPTVFQYATGGWHNYTFHTPFYWNGNDNLVLTIFVNQPAGTSHYSSYFYGYSTNCGYTRTCYRYRDGSQYTQQDNSSGSSGTSNYRPSVTFYVSQCVQPENCLSPTVHVESTTDSSICLSWIPGGQETEWKIEYQLDGQSSWTTVQSHCSGQQYCVTGLERASKYNIRISSICDGTVGRATTIQATTACSDNYCFDYTNLTASNVTCRYGSYYNADQNIGVIDYGYENYNSRHTIHSDLSETDPRTNNQLHTIPEGYCSSVRLGNWNTGSQAESITYEYTVDTVDHDLLLLKYAAVMENPGHPSSEQPKFTFMITDANNNIVNPCYNATFISSSSLGWNTAGSGVLWKDWTTVGVDLSPLHGQTIYIK